uniref:Peptidase S1 domain-containing protein n=1 Tax=Panagrolaimus sp. ES5 TaxID=591445 RepID=A0AC34G9F0_9BILA
MFPFILLILAVCLSFSEAENIPCGISSSLEKYAIYNPNRILGGENAKDGDWPWYALITSGSRLCGATIVSDKWILTAAHCFDKKSIDVSIQYGSVNRSGGENDTSQKIFIHSGFNEDSGINDIALIELEKPLNFSENVQSICLNHSVEPNANEILAMVGFGKIFKQFQGSTAEFIHPDILQDGPIAYKQNSTISEGCDTVKICVSGINHAALSGDSGGPLMTIRDNRWFQIGVASMLKYVSGVFEDESITMATDSM